jgi:hypothetical protein
MHRMGQSLQSYSLLTWAPILSPGCALRLHLNDDNSHQQILSGTDRMRRRVLQGAARIEAMQYVTSLCRIPPYDCK